MELYGDNSIILRRYSISSAANGAGEISGSFRTPRGRHVIRAKIGAGAPANTVFVRRRPTGEIWAPELGAANPARDWILSRILWLSGREPGFNRLGQVDTMRRYIYLHGSPDTVAMGLPGSIGCIRMRNADIIELFDLVPLYTRVDIGEFGVEEDDWAGFGNSAGFVREAVFIREQGVSVAMEYDQWDRSSLHALARGPEGHPIGTGRLLPDGHIGRLAVLREWRNRGVGSIMLLHLLNAARGRGMERVVLEAQTSAEGFYRRFGFTREGTEFMDAGIPHIQMSRTLSA